VTSPSTRSNNYLTFSAARARLLQESLSQRVIETDSLPVPPKYICGIDISYTKNKAFAAAVLLKFPELKILEKICVSCKVNIPYIPGFLAFRELRPSVLAFKKLNRKPDVVLIDGHGRAHPRFFGLACHFGVVLDIPSIGVAKKKLCGEILYDRFITGSSHPIIYKERIIGAAVKVSSNRFLYVSVGHKVSLETAIKIVLSCVKHPRMPEPIRIAHHLCTISKY